MFCTGGHLPHGVLHVFTDVAKTLRYYANRNRNNRCQHNQNDRQLPTVIEHHDEQADDRRTFTHNSNQCAGRRRSNLFGIVGDT
ncbi:hypothetical protein DP20_3688 [Shigella flexneri]|nr:hypothetical protein DP20_3688 [Shigella flexneri]